jgi:S-adenosylmethionine:tRNA ribosyltransferase-isomerase
LEAEAARIPLETADKIGAAKREGRRVIAVGTTTTRALESAAEASRSVTAGDLRAGVFIVPGFRFRVVDAMLTNFHLPRSTLLMLVSAFAGRERILDSYGIAVREGYRFYSYGDAMLIC